MIKLKQAKTVGELIEVLSQYRFSTPINTSCNECRHGWSGGSVVVEDFTNQTYGYVDLRINQSGYKSNLSRSEKEHKVIIMAHLLKYDMPRIGRMDDDELHETYRTLWRDLEVESIRI